MAAHTCGVDETTKRSVGALQGALQDRGPQGRQLNPTQRGMRVGYSEALAEKGYF